MFKLAMLTSAALALAGSAALAATPAQSGFHFKAHAVPTQPSGFLSAPVPPGLYGLSAQFGLLPPKDGNGHDEWPCYGGGSNADCSSIANNGVVVGIPIYTWSLSSCDSSTPCGQIYFFYQDQTGDSTDDLILTVSVKQGSSYILAVGPDDIGPNPYAGETVVFSGDKAFGTEGESGKGTGWCAGSKRTCVDPVAGLATGEAVIQVGDYTMKEKFLFWLE